MALKTIVIEIKYYNITLGVLEVWLRQVHIGCEFSMIRGLIFDRPQSRMIRSSSLLFVYTRRILLFNSQLTQVRVCLDTVHCYN